MKNKTLMYSLVGLAAGGTLTGILLINRTEAQTQAFRHTPSLLAQTQHPQGSPSPSSTGMRRMMNQQQVARHFIEMMIPHHQGAVDMANLALSKAKHPELKKLAQAIKTGQTQEIEDLKTWYKKWYGTDVPTTPSMGMPMHSGTGMNQGMPVNSGLGMDMTNMMGMMNVDLETLKNAPDFDKAFIEHMIPHHKMAVMMAGMVLDSPHPELRNLGKVIIQTQSAEIEQMLGWQQAWSR
jgi:uncharacterized protein (DUF305 family)